MNETLSLSLLDSAVLSVIGTSEGITSFVFARGSVEVALHLSCEWRMQDGGELLVGASDIYARNPDAGPAGSALRRIADMILARERSHRTVSSINLNRMGDVRVEFQEGLVLRCFVSSRFWDQEAWRLFRRGFDEPHLLWIHGALRLDTE